MSFDDNELTSLTWLHTLSILPQDTNTVSQNTKNNNEGTFCLRSPKTSSEKKNINQPDSSCTDKNPSDSSKCASTNSSSISLGQKLEKSSETKPFPIRINTTLAERSPNSKIQTFTRNQSGKTCKSVEETTTSNTSLKSTIGLSQVRVCSNDIINIAKKGNAIPLSLIAKDR